MCGFAGFVDSAPPPGEGAEGRLQRMTRTLHHRGPDEEGYFVGDGAALGSRRLKVIDLEAGRMPLANEDGSVMVVYNGEIYNHRELRTRLESNGHRFATRADTEVLVHLYEDEGDDLARHLRGMFAFAIWDRKRRRLLLGRDRLGIKPLFYRDDGSELVFGSELKALTAAADGSPDLDREAILEYLALGYIRAPRSVYRGFRKLPPGHVLVREADGRTRLDPYWSYPARPGPRPRGPEEAADELDALLRSAVSERLVADVPLGSFLSGGVDSSLVSAMAAAEKGTRLETFCLGWEGSPEPAYARMVADHIGSEHHELTVDALSADLAEELMAFFDEPFADSSAIPTYLVSGLARSRVTVALSGDGGDELFAGYDQYMYDAAFAWTDRIPKVLRRSLVGAPAALLPPGTRGRRRLRAIALDREERYADYVTAELDPARGGILSRELAAEAPEPMELFADRFAAARGLPVAQRLLYADATGYLPDDILTKVDRMSMAHSLEARVPLLDHRVVEFAARIPMEWKIRDGTGKWLLKRVAARYLPEPVLTRTKHGFSIPVDRWLRGPLRERVEAMARVDETASGSFLDRAGVERTVREHLDEKRDHSGLLWRLLVLEMWLSGQRAPVAGAASWAGPTAPSPTSDGGHPGSTEPGPPRR